MKVLFISPNRIMGNNGGSIGQRKLYDSLKTLFSEGKIQTLEVISLDEDIEYKAQLDIQKTKHADICSRVFFHSNYLWIYKRKIISYIHEKGFTCILLGNSRLGFLSKAIQSKNSDIRVITHFDNVELDYVYSYYQGKKGLLKKIQRRIELICVKRDEKKAVRYAEKLMVLSERDRKRLVEIYRKPDIKFVIYPVCIDKKQTLLPCQSPKLVFVGTLNYASNYEALKWLLQIFDKQSFFPELVVAGAAPDSKIVDTLNANGRIKAFFNFKNYGDFAHAGDILVSPIVTGAGMKVKVAEAMSMGLLVCGTSETFVGYEISFTETNGLFICNTEEEYMKTFALLYELSISEILEISRNNIENYQRHYSAETSYRIMKEVIGDLNERK